MSHNTDPKQRTLDSIRHEVNNHDIDQFAAGTGGGINPDDWGITEVSPDPVCVDPEHKR